MEREKAHKPIEPNGERRPLKGMPTGNRERRERQNLHPGCGSETTALLRTSWGGDAQSDRHSLHKALITYVLLCGLLLLAVGHAYVFLIEGLALAPLVALTLLLWRSPSSPITRALIILVGVSLFAFPLYLATVHLHSASPGSAIGQDVFPAIAIGFSLACSAAMLAPPARRALAKSLPIDPNLLRHAVGLMLLVGLTVSLLAPQVFWGAWGAYGAYDASIGTAGEQLARTVYDLALIVPLVFVAAGWPWRSGRATACRLGLALPSLRRALLGAGVGLLLVVAATWILSPAIIWTWEAAGWPQTDATLISRLFSWAANPGTALLVSVAAGVKEELLVRGLLQPRYGLFLSNLAFSALHAGGYRWDGLLSVFVIGIALGALRARTNTATAMLAHATYDFVALVTL